MPQLSTGSVKFELINATALRNDSFPARSARSKDHVPRILPENRMTSSR